MTLFTIQCLKTGSFFHTPISLDSKTYKVFRKNCIFSHSTATHSSSKFSTQYECTVTLAGWSFSERPIAAELARDRSTKTIDFFSEHPIDA